MNDVVSLGKFGAELDRAAEAIGTRIIKTIHVTLVACQNQRGGHFRVKLAAAAGARRMSFFSRPAPMSKRAQVLPSTN